MADGFKILAQAMMRDSGLDGSGNPTLPLADDALDLIYQVPSPSGERFATRGNSQAIISSISVCHVHSSSGAHEYSIRVVEDVSSPGFANKQYIIYNKGINNSTTDVLSLGIGLVSGNGIYAEAYAGGTAGTASDIAITIFGTEVL